MNITDLPNIQSVLEYIDEKYPKWVYKICDKYSNDYNYLNSNWVQMARVFNTTKKKIIIVENMLEDELYTFAELLTKVGFIIRTKDEYIYCSKCNKCIPTEKTFNIMKEKNIQFIPESYSTFCSSC
jgi:hypothetical protein